MALQRYLDVGDLCDSYPIHVQRPARNHPSLRDKVPGRVLFLHDSSGFGLHQTIDGMKMRLWFGCFSHSRTILHWNVVTSEINFWEEYL